MKKHTSKQMIKSIQEEPESRREWMLRRFAFDAKYRPNVKEYKFWQNGNHAKECISPEFLFEKLDYIHQNPVRTGDPAELDC